MWFKIMLCNKLNSRVLCYLDYRHPCITTSSCKKHPVVDDADFKSSKKVLRNRTVFNNDRFACIDCPFSTNKEESIRKHAVKHSGEGRVNSASPSLKSSTPHSKVPHVYPRSSTPVSKTVAKSCVSKRFTCNQCSFKCSTESEMSKHLNVHVPKPPHNCTYCNQTFHFQNDLASHLSQHSMKAKEVFKCKFCPQVFTRLSILSYHFKTHTQSKSFQCEKCNKVFFDIISFTQHESIHRS